ncbi:MAG: hypothetical protein EOP83_14680 [Verrucomicrobiaceae bacterium]|nr:MAG: hypothetical protein EOP83_14680 [Verrucomicrobiaceae bacterium]
MATIKIGKLTVTGEEVIITGNAVSVDGEALSQSEAEKAFLIPGVVNITLIDGTLQNLTTDGTVNVAGNVKGNITAGNSINCEAVGGNVEAGNNIRCGRIGGSATAKGSIRHA